MNRLQQQNIKFPVFLPDATRAITKSLDSLDLNNAAVNGIVVNTYHLMTNPGTGVLKKFGGIKNFMNFNGLVVSDSGGWQVFSLIKRNNLPGKIDDNGVIFSISKNQKEVFTPEKSIQVQFDLGSDIIICLDDFVGQNASYRQAEEVVNRTIKWARRCKDEYNKLIDKHRFNNETRPLLFSVIQGGYKKDLRKKCADELINIDFDGYGFGGYVVDEASGKLNLEISQYVAELIPDDKYKFALGVGKPEDIGALHKMGWQIFDCTLPTRDARHRRLYVSESDDGSKYQYLYINKKIHECDAQSIDPACDCHTCKNFSRAYLHHLFKIEDTSALRLATIHNLRYYTRMMQNLQEIT